jgi:hypothetical protein
MPYRAFTPLVIVVLCLGAGFAQSSHKPSTADQKRTIRVGIAAPMNRSTDHSCMGTGSVGAGVAASARRS